LLNESAATNLGLELRPALGAGKNPVPGYHLARLKGLELGDIELDDLPVIVLDFDAALKHRAPDAEGFLPIRHSRTEL
jgi:hypothetical protein